MFSIYSFLLPLIAIASTVANLLTIIAFWKEPRLREKPSELLILALAIVDCFTGFIVVPLLSPIYIFPPGNWPLQEIGCRVLVTSSTAALTGSMFLLIAISLDRFLLVSLEYPRYVKIQSKRQIYVNIALALGAALLVSSLEQVFWNVAKTLDAVASSINFDEICLSPSRRLAAFSSAFFILFYCVPVLMVGVLSAGFLIDLRKLIKRNNRIDHAQNEGSTVDPSTSATGRSHIRTVSSKVSTGETSTHIHSSDASIRNRYIKPGLTLIALVMAMATTMLPYCLYLIIVEWICSECSNTKVLYNVLLLQYFNACLDPIFFAATQSKIRRFYKKRIKDVFRNRWRL